MHGLHIRRIGKSGISNRELKANVEVAIHLLNVLSISNRELKDSAKGVCKVEIVPDEGISNRELKGVLWNQCVSMLIASHLK